MFVLHVFHHYFSRVVNVNQVAMLDTTILLEPVNPAPLDVDNVNLLQAVSNVTPPSYSVLVHVLLDAQLVNTSAMEPVSTVHQHVLHAHLQLFALVALLDISYRAITPVSVLAPRIPSPILPLVNALTVTQHVLPALPGTANPVPLAQLI